jgi:hypothetical protein
VGSYSRLSQLKQWCSGYALRHRTASGSRVRDERVTGRQAGGRLRQSRHQNMPICRMVCTGVTGLEPATSGVRGRRSFRQSDPQTSTGVFHRLKTGKKRISEDSQCLKRRDLWCRTSRNSRSRSSKSASASETSLTQLRETGREACRGQGGCFCRQPELASMLLRRAARLLARRATRLRRREAVHPIFRMT